MHSTHASSSESNIHSLADAALEQVVSTLEHAARLSCAANASFADREAVLLGFANEAVRRCLRAELQRIEDAHTPELFVDGHHYRRHEPGEVEYHSLCGSFAIRRWTYREIGVRNGPTVVPVELAAGIIRNATPALAFSVGQGFARGPIREYAEDMLAAHRVLPSRSTLERMARWIGGGAARDVVLIEPILRADERLPEGAHAISAGMDRTTVPMAEERPPDQPPNSRRKKRTKPRIRKAPHPIDVQYRMAYVGTVSIVDKNGEALVTRRYHATHEEGPQEMTSRMMADITHALAQKKLPLVIVQDGAPEMWNEMRDALRSVGIKKWTEVIDRFHVSERLWLALELAERNPQKRRALYEHWQHRLERSDRAIYAIRDWIRDKIKACADFSRKKYLLESHDTYIFGNECRMRYASMRKRGFPIASGVTEGACKSLVAMRAKRSGQRWQQDGLTAALTLRALLQSSRLRPFWAFYQRRYYADIKAAM